MKLRTVPVAELSVIRMVAGGEKRHSIVVDEGRVKEWVGFGWIDLGPATEQDKRKHPLVVRSDK